MYHILYHISYISDIEYTIVNRIQMGCCVQDDESEIQDEYFNEEVVKDTIVEGIESKDRTFLKKKKSQGHY